MAHLIHRLAVALVALAGLAGLMTVVPWQEVPAPPPEHVSVTDVVHTAGLDLPLRDQATTVAPMSVTITQPPAALPFGQDAHSAFPGLARLPGGILKAVYRQGSDHYLKRDGRIQRNITVNDGDTWEPGTHLRANGADYRDPSISWARGAEWLTWFTGSAANPAMGAWSQREFGVPVRIDPNMPYAAITAPVIELPNGQVGTVFYARQGTEQIDTPWFTRSANHGQSWSAPLRIANGIGGGRAYTEPYMVADGSQIHVLFRSGSDALAMVSSSDSGTTWSGARQIITQATGRPSTVVTGSGVLVTVYRAVPTRDAEIAYSADHGQTWSKAGVLLGSEGGIGMTYAAMVPEGPDGVFGIVGLEEVVNGVSVSKLYGFRLAI